jgi:uncharacterized protein YdaU (DUF1376 family)
MNLLFVFAQWHGFVKLRLHTDHTIGILDDTTTQLGDHLREFVETTCKEIPTKELRREYEARKRREAKAAKNKGTTRGSNKKGKAPQNPSSEPLASIEEEGVEPVVQSERMSSYSICYL